MRVLTLTTLYPHAANPSHGVFVENRLRQLIAIGGVDLRVIAPVPWFPSKSELFGHYATFAKAPMAETRHDIQITHPRYLLLPKIGMTHAVQSLTSCFEKQARQLLSDGWDFDVIDAHYYYPDGVAAVEVASRLGKPVVVTGRGTDINLIPQYERQRTMILEAADKADASITVCQALKDEMIHLGADDKKISVLRNGVDLDAFKPLDRDSIRTEMDLRGTIILSVGHLIGRKGHDLAIQAMQHLPDATLLIAGDGPEEKALKALATKLNLNDRIQFLGRLPHEYLPRLYNAADILVLASSREGWPNVLLEAMACGTPAVASPVWGAGEVITAPEAGMLADQRTVDSIANALKTVLATPPTRAQTRAYAEQYSWADTITGYKSLLANVITQYPLNKTPHRQNNDWKISAPLPLNDKTPKLFITIDTEEIFNWDKNDFNNHTIADPADIAAFQAVCERHGAKPLYFITWPLMKDAATVAYFKNLHSNGKADLGLHLHQWVTPPHDQENTLRNSYQCNLSSDLHQQKLRELVSTFEAAFGFKPTSHRAGRYGVSPQIHDALLAENIPYDFSPNPGNDQSSVAGPDFSGTGNAPWIRETANGNRLYCLPVTGGRCWRHTSKLLAPTFSPPGNTRPLPGVFKKISASMRLTPEGIPLSELCRFTKNILKKDITLLTYSLHSTSLTIGATPYSGHAANVEEILQKSDAYFKWFREQNNGVFIDLSFLDDLYKKT